jgi:pSer/pThr/pTyr-binding forkhead associated (FHA) protein
MSGSKPYEEPEWARGSQLLAGSSSSSNHTNASGQLELLEFALEVIKDGAVVGEIPLVHSGESKKSFFIVGRQPDVVDILLEHPSISRQHAILQFRDDDALMCMDFNSAQGTFVNKVQLERNVCQRLYVGDIVKFGASTRLYVVKGPESQMKPEYDSENLRLLRKKLGEKSVVAAKQKVEREAATWGFDDDAEDEDDDGVVAAKQKKEPEYLRKDPNYHRKFESTFSSKIKDADVDPKDNARLLKLRAKETKIQNMMEENRRIYMKEGSQDNGFTEGQAAAVARNDTRIEELTSEIEVLIHEITGKKAQRENAKDGKNKKKRRADSDDDDDDLYDETLDTQDVNTNWRLKRKLMKRIGNPEVKGAAGHNGGMTYGEIKEWVDSLRRRQMEIESELEAGETVINEASSGILTAVEDIDAVLLQSDASTAKTNSSKLKNEETKLLLELKRAEKLLIAATPAIKQQAVKRDTPASGILTSKVAEIMQSLTAPQIRGSGDLHETLPPATQTPELHSADSESGKTAGSCDDGVVSSELTAPAVVTDDVSEAAKTTTFNTLASPPESRVLGPHRPAAADEGTPAAESLENDLPPCNTDGEQASCSLELPKVLKAVSSPVNKKVKKAIKEPLTFDSSTLQDGEKVWVKPKNQSGNGRTWLNEKFGY